MTLPRASRRITTTLLAVQSLGSAGTIAAATVASIIGAELSGHTALAGLPASVGQLGGAFSALGWSLLSDRLGRRGGLALGVATGSVGAGLALVSVVQGSFVFLLLSLALMASAQASFNLGRFAAAEVNPPARRGRAVALVVLGGTVGSVVGPTLVGFSGGVASGLGANELAGPYGVTFVLFAAAAVVLALFLKPEPKGIALEVARAHPQPEFDAATARPLSTLLRQPRHRRRDGRDDFGLRGDGHAHGHHRAPHEAARPQLARHLARVLGAHLRDVRVFNRDGWLIDRWGRKQVVVSGRARLDCGVSRRALSTAFGPLALALFLLGLG